MLFLDFLIRFGESLLDRTQIVRGSFEQIIKIRLIDTASLRNITIREISFFEES